MGRFPNFQYKEFNSARPGSSLQFLAFEGGPGPRQAGPTAAVSLLTQHGGAEARRPCERRCPGDQARARFKSCALQAAACPRIRVPKP